MGPAIVVATLLYLDPTYCQISSTLHISLSDLEQVALSFTSPPAVVVCRLQRSRALLPPSPALWPSARALRPPLPALRPSVLALRPSHRRRAHRGRIGRHRCLRFCRQRGRFCQAITGAPIAGVHIAGASAAIAGASHRQRAPWLSLLGPGAWLFVLWDNRNGCFASRLRPAVTILQGRAWAGWSI